MLLRPFSWLAVSILIASGLVQGSAGCRSFSVNDEPLRSTPARPLWSDESLREHLRFLNGSDVEGRATGTAGYAIAASYVAALMAEYGLQPGLASNAQVVYPTPFNEIRAAIFTGSAPSDTLMLYPGVDYLPDGRSDSGHVEINSLVIGPTHSGEAGTGLGSSGEGFLLPAHTASTDVLEALRDAGVPVVLMVGTLTPRPALRPVKGLIVVHIQPEAVVRLLGIARSTLEAALEGTPRTVWHLARPVRLRVETHAFSTIGAINVLGFVPGKHPSRARELVIVCADLDAIGTFAGVPTLDAAHLGVGTGALLEVARQYALFARFGSMPERSILFAVFSGARQEYTGLREYLRHPLWALDHTRTLVYVGLDPADEPAVRDLLTSHDVPLSVVAAPPDTFGTEGIFLLPVRRPPRRRTLRPPGDEGFGSDPPRLSDLIENGVVRARRMAEALHAVLLHETVSGASLVPVHADSLRIPRAMGQ